MFSDHLWKLESKTDLREVDVMCSDGDKVKELVTLGSVGTMWDDETGKKTEVTHHVGGKSVSEKSHNTHTSKNPFDFENHVTVITHHFYLKGQNTWFLKFNGKFEEDYKMLSKTGDTHSWVYWNH